jgi:hypothetical protein
MNISGLSCILSSQKIGNVEVDIAFELGGTEVVSKLDGTDCGFS